MNFVQKLHECASVAKTQSKFVSLCNSIESTAKEFGNSLNDFYLTKKTAPVMPKAKETFSDSRLYDNNSIAERAAIRLQKLDDEFEKNQK